MNKNINPVFSQLTDEKQMKEYFEFRWLQLRAPLGMGLETTKDDKEDEAEHFVAKLEEKIIACARVQEVQAKIFQLRYMAVEEEFRKLNIGKGLIKHIENHIKAKDAKTLFLNARYYAIPFYLKVGFREHGEEHTEIGIIHQKMIKDFI